MKKNISLFFILSLLFFSCATGNSVSKLYSENDRANNFKTAEEVKPQWEALTEYSERFDFTVENPKAVCHAFKIDLTNPALCIFPYPGVTGSKLKQGSVKAKNFACDMDIVINTVPFAQKIKALSPKKPAGIVYAYGQKKSEPVDGYCAFYVYKNDKSYFCKIEQNQTPFSNDGDRSLVLVHGGFWQIIKDGQHINFKDIKDSRTAVGISKDNKHLYVLIVEGERKSQSQGLSYGECALIFDGFGAFNAMQFDGGSSTTLYVKGKNALSYPKNPSLPGFLGFSTGKFDK